MSSTEDTEVKAGHPPAVKAGGMRIVQHKHEKGEPAPAQTKEEQEEFGPEPPKPDTHHQNLVISGAVTKGDKDFKAEAIKAYHDKPLPTHDKKTHQKPRDHIHQPQK
ncbi:hypothetical protein FSP39_004363 [Pinctada imbricata]|uniref:Death-associated protein 1 n=1 Tax=Pinctada imbricata TaxID=66713 RepID=A0AA88XDL0_PINIB|nr:hypothetical protein FSP39_004363 [Pinctada imbricata]